MARQIYGDAKYDHLLALKRAWDPDNVFRPTEENKARGGCDHTSDSTHLFPSVW